MLTHIYGYISLLRVKFSDNAIPFHLKRKNTQLSQADVSFVVSDAQKEIRIIIDYILWVMVVKYLNLKLFP